MDSTKERDVNKQHCYFKMSKTILMKAGWGTRYSFLQC